MTSNSDTGPVFSRPSGATGLGDAARSILIASAFSVIPGSVYAWVSVMVDSIDLDSAFGGPLYTLLVIGALVGFASCSGPSMACRQSICRSISMSSATGSTVAHGKSNSLCAC